MGAQNYVYGMATKRHTFAGGDENLAAAVQTHINTYLDQVVEIRMSDPSNAWSYKDANGGDAINVAAGEQAIVPWIDGHEQIVVNGTGASVLQVVAFGPRSGEGPI